MELFTCVKAYSSLKLFDLRSENGHLLYQILFKCDLQGERRPEKRLSLLLTDVGQQQQQ